MANGKNKNSNDDDAPARGVPLDFNETAVVNPWKLLRKGIATIANEIDRLVLKSKATGLNGSEARSLKEYVQTVSDIFKKHPTVHLGLTDQDDIENVSDEELRRIVIECARIGKVDLSQLSNGKLRQKVIDHDDSN